MNTWADILNQVPGSKLLIKTKELADELTQQRVLSLLRDNGIDETRISLKAAMPNKEDHLNLYSEIDIALDSFPFNGATTTDEAMWMNDAYPNIVAVSAVFTSWCNAFTA